MNDIVFNEQYCTISQDGFIKLKKEHINNNFQNRNIVIPEKINNIKVVGLTGNFLSNTKIQNVTFPSTLEIIGTNSFYNCSNITEISLPDNLCFVEEKCFSNCKNLNTINYADETDFGNNVFQNTKWLNNLLNISKNISALIINNLLVYGGPCDINVEIPDYISIINDKAFENNEDVTTVYIPDSVNQIGANAFNNCEYLEEIYMSNNVSIIGENAFGNYETNIFYDANKDQADETFSSQIKNGKIDINKCNLYCNINDSQYQYHYENIDQNNTKERLCEINTDETIITPDGILKEVVFINDIDNIGDIVYIPEKINNIKISKISADAIVLPQYTRILYLPNTIDKIDENAIVSDDLITVRFSGDIALFDVGVNSASFSFCPSLQEIYFSNKITFNTLQAFDDSDIYIYGEISSDIDQDIEDFLDENDNDYNDINKELLYNGYMDNENDNYSSEDER